MTDKVSRRDFVKAGTAVSVAAIAPARFCSGENWLSAL